MLLCGMKRTTISLPDELADLVKREARRRATSVSALTKDALSAYLGVGSREPRRIPFAGVARSGFQHTARDAEEILAAKWDPSRDR